MSKGETCRLFPPLLTQAWEFAPILPIIIWWQAPMSQSGVPQLGCGMGIPGHQT